MGGVCTCGRATNGASACAVGIREARSGRVDAKHTAAAYRCMLLLGVGGKDVAECEADIARKPGAALRSMLVGMCGGTDERLVAPGEQAGVGVASAGEQQEDERGAEVHRVSWVARGRG